MSNKSSTLNYARKIIYPWCDMLITYYSSKIMSDEDSYGHDIIRIHRKIAEEFILFKDEYICRVRADDWYIDNV